MRVSVVITIICALLQQVSGQNPRNHWTLLPNILVVEVNGSLGQQPLTCLESAAEVMKREDQGRDIIWKKDGVEETERGNSYLVGLEESLGGGNYTCHSKNGSLLNHTEVLIREDETKNRRIIVPTEEDYLKCSAQNYNGAFHCSWKWHPNRLGTVAFIRARRGFDDDDVQCSVDTSGQHWMCSSRGGDISCSVHSSGQGISCLEKQHCPYAEETQHIDITVFVRNNYFLVESYSKVFYLSEIVKPDKVRISKVNRTTVEWSYPSSWSSPYSYFPLTFQIAQIRAGCKKCDDLCIDPKATKTMLVNSPDVCQLKVKRRVMTVCVRAKDALCDSQWSDWSHYRSAV
ncbi:interleukin 12Ba precursor [Diretmus argenteus]